MVELSVGKVLEGEKNIKCQISKTPTQDSGEETHLVVAQLIELPLLGL